MRLFIAVAIPEQVRARLRKALEHFSEYVREAPSDNRWHLTLVFLGEVEETEKFRQQLPDLARALPKLFTPTVTLTHAGPGRAKGQLWAYAQPTGPLMDIQLTLQEKVAQLVPGTAQRRAFVPHVRLASLKPEAKGAVLADYPLGLSFAVREAQLWHSDISSGRPHYETMGTITLAA
jgi:2'-5' RNA ligase